MLSLDSVPRSISNANRSSAPSAIIIRIGARTFRRMGTIMVGSELDHRLDEPCIRRQPRRQRVDQALGGGTMRDPRSRVNLAAFDELDDALKIGWQRVARREQRDLAAV